MTIFQDKQFNTIVVACCCVAGLLAILVYALHSNFFIIRWSSATVQPLQAPTMEKKKVKLYFYKQKQIRAEEKELLWPANMQKALQFLVASWVDILFEEELVKKRVTLQSVIVLPSGTQAYISFDRSPLNKASSVFDKLMLLQSLLRTLQESGIVLQQVQFLVHHQPLRDIHLDFSRPWPASGYT